MELIARPLRISETTIKTYIREQNVTYLTNHGNRGIVRQRISPTRGFNKDSGNKTYPFPVGTRFNKD